MSEIEELQIVGYHVDSVIGKNILDNTNVFILTKMLTLGVSRK